MLCVPAKVTFLQLNFFKSSTPFGIPEELFKWLEILVYSITLIDKHHWLDSLVDGKGVIVVILRQ